MQYSSLLAIVGIVLLTSRLAQCPQIAAQNEQTPLHYLHSRSRPSLMVPFVGLPRILKERPIDQVKFQLWPAHRSANNMFRPTPCDIDVLSFSVEFLSTVSWEVWYGNPL